MINCRIIPVDRPDAVNFYVELPIVPRAGDIICPSRTTRRYRATQIILRDVSDMPVVEVEEVLK